MYRTQRLVSRKPSSFRPLRGTVPTLFSQPRFHQTKPNTVRDVSDSMVNARWIIPVVPENKWFEHHSVVFRKGMKTLAVNPTLQFPDFNQI